MPTDYVLSFLWLACAGLGLCLVGAANLLLSRARVRGRVGVTVVLLGSRRVTAGASSAVASLRRPAVRFAVVTAAGVGLIVASVAGYERADRAAMDEDTARLEVFGGGTPTFNSSHRAATDRGTPIGLREPRSFREPSELSAGEQEAIGRDQTRGPVMRRGPVGDNANCYGWVFTGGRFLLTDADVELILKENGYEEVAEPQPGDAVVYRAGGQVVHAALVRYVAEGQPVLVEGKWGAFGVFLHPADRSIYGTEYTFHRSARANGHIVAGVAGPTLPPTAPVPTTAE
jgi:hypothetical protein